MRMGAMDAGKLINDIINNYLLLINNNFTQCLIRFSIYIYIINNQLMYCSVFLGMIVSGFSVLYIYIYIVVMCMNDIKITCMHACMASCIA